MDIDIKLNDGKWFSLNKEQVDTVKKIANDFPYSIELVTGIFIEQKYSEEKTRKILSYRTLHGGESVDDIMKLKHPFDYDGEQKNINWRVK